MTSASTPDTTVPGPTKKVYQSKSFFDDMERNPFFTYPFTADPPEYEDVDLEKGRCLNMNTVFKEVGQEGKFFEDIFEGYKDHDIIPGRTESYGMRKKDFKYFNYGFHSPGVTFLRFVVDNYTNGNRDMNSPHNLYFDKSYCLSLLVNRAADIKSGAINNPMKLSKISFPKRVVTEDDLGDMKRSNSFTSLYQEYAARQGDTGLLNAAKKLLYVGDKNSPILIAVNHLGKAMKLYPIENTSLEKDTIYLISETVDMADDINNSVSFPIPIGSPIVIKEYPCVLFDKEESMKSHYTKVTGTAWKDDTLEMRVSGLKTLVGKLMNGSGVSDYSHGLMSLAIGISLKRDCFWASSTSGIRKIETINPRNSGNDFERKLKEFNLTREMLNKNDYIFKRELAGSGLNSSMTILSEERLEVPVGFFKEASKSFLDDDFLIFTKLGLAIFSTKSAADAAFRAANGDPMKLMDHLSGKKETSKEKKEFIGGMKEAVYIGTGALIPKLIKMLADKLLNKETLIMGTAITTTAATSTTAVAAVSGFLGGFFPVVAGGAVATAFFGTAWITNAWGWITSGISFVWDKVKAGFSYGVAKVKEGLTWTWEKVKSIGSWGWNKLKSAGSWLLEKAKGVVSWIGGLFSN